MIANELRQTMEEMLCKCQEIKCGININTNVRWLSSNLSSAEMFLLGGMMDTLSPEEVKFVKNVIKEVRGILNPVFEKLAKKAQKHFKKWYRRISPNMDLYKYQYFISLWTIEAVILRKDVTVPYTLLVSRGAGKTFLLSAVATFFLIYWKKYMIHSKYIDFSILIGCPFEDQLASFYNYTHQFVALSVAENIIGSNEKEGISSEEKLYISKDNSGEMNLTTIVKGRSANVYSRFFYKVALKSMESKHADLLLLDEAKMVSAKNLYTSVLPCVGGRVGQAVLISSASEEYCLFQDLIEDNKTAELDDGIKRHIELHYSKMIQYNPSYAFTVARARKGDKVSFLTQYDNKFLSEKKSSFADMHELSKLGIFNYDSAQDKRLGDYVIVAGWDIAVTGDNSVLVIKAMENKIGVKRKSWIINMFIMNKIKDKTIDSVYNQAKRVVPILLEYQVDFLTIDGTGVGKSASSYVIEEAENRGSYRYAEHNVVEVNLNPSIRNEVLTNYYNRLNSGYENFRKIDDTWKEETVMKDRYALVQSENEYDLQSIWVRFIFEHMKFIRKEVENETTGVSKTVYMQEALSWIHDDTIFGSALCSHSIYLDVTLLKWEEAPQRRNKRSNRSISKNPRTKGRGRRR